MATAFRDWPWPLQALFYVGLAIILIVAGLWIPGLPNQRVRADLESAKSELKPLESEVESLRVYQQRRTELQGEMDALAKQLETLQTIVPEDKQVDQFIIMMQGAASSSGVTIRLVPTKPIVAREYHYEMPFEIEADGPYYAVLDFFSKLSKLSRIINVGDAKLTGVNSEGTGRFQMTPGTTVTGVMTVTTFFTTPAGQQPATTTAAARR